jgi:transcriptional regulator GlxA family with amidase domain
MLNSWGKTASALPVTPFDRECVRRAQAILEGNLEDPPSLSELASRVGVSTAKLKQVFPRVCGMPPYSYLRTLRMKKAFCLLGDGSLTITEVAYGVGYNSISHFSKVFADHFGMKPSEFRNLFRERHPPHC